ncbi:4-(cytidine 5'-diphospho)-2-C-methyl-D-erythritol kinase [Sphingosinicella microcystinivorans]|uniref:4-(cytidine 5'-diphospho)-2-C-methyl-D-erythritol kinase n=1 Tax=Sphingosinicella microcystinivorans TaxID=335406 RepID=UPI0022F3F780|nr:4-(cytidine 5'-diphospho)-2-C-methyl-D-erythritol kinase [Sphingosinicella microcystinivorans]WBX83267.1 4-(cytidine 5'-diphospho)-2-C-methyl-D-erythritol kinase [Sphingosinicella microcystinivorans]
MTGDAAAETGWAKINLALHVRRRRADGYHDIETIFAFADFGDMLTVRAADDVTLTICGPFGAGLSADEGNLVMRAARALAGACGIAAGAALALDKRLPVASGIGGGSADAAAALRLLNRFWGIGADEAALRAIAAPLGADVPACVGSRTQRGDGAGEQLRGLADDDLRGKAVLLVNPGVPLATGPVFAAWDGIDRGTLAGGPPLAAAKGARNDLQAPAVSLCPAIGAVLEALAARPGAALTRMSGSGATCFALFEADADAEAARAAIASAHPGWWAAAGRLR